MLKKDFDTLMEATDYLTSQGYTEDFKASDTAIVALYSKKEYHPTELKIDTDLRFDGNTNPDDESELFAITANDGTKGTLIMSYSADHNQNVDLVKQIERSSK